MDAAVFGKFLAETRRAEAGDTLLSLLSGPFALAAIALAWLREKRH